jgi:hypothetical protein
MNNEDYNIIFSALSEVLRQKEMHWVLDQVNEQIRLGKTESKEISPRDEDHRQNILLDVSARPRTIRGRARKKEEFLVTTEYTPKERLLLLIDAIEQAVVNTNRMVHDTLEFTHAEFNIDEITFYSEEEQKLKTFQTGEFEINARQIMHLKDLLEKLRSQVNAN